MKTTLRISILDHLKNSIPPYNLFARVDSQVPYLYFFLETIFQTSMKDLCFDHQFGMSREEKDPQMVKGDQGNYFAIVLFF